MMQNVPSPKRLTTLLSIIAVLLLLAGYLFIVYPSLDPINTLKSGLRMKKPLLKPLKKRQTNKMTIMKK
ncbi:hypothetical protein ACJROX_20655 [Pseudalkalibacillus sp. A8]|uniref:hypothetical protein n=1 Tax=Pseudalkalibacillus sp. A8 TaxID=3382641 RepID=UPI0038B5BA52